MNMKQGHSWDMAHHPPMPRPKNDDGYFEEMSKGESTSIMFLFGVGEEMLQPNVTENAGDARNYSLNLITVLECPSLCWQAFALPVSAGSHAKRVEHGYSQLTLRPSEEQGHGASTACPTEPSAQ